MEPKSTEGETSKRHEETENEEPLLWEDPVLNKADITGPGYDEGGLYCEYGGGLQYLQGGGWSRYYPSLRHLIPVRRTKKERGTLGVDNAGLWSFLTFSWLTKYIMSSYRQRFKLEDVPKPSPYDTCQYNVQRLEMLWQKELSAQGPRTASLARVTWAFMRTRVILATVIFSLNILLNFLSIAVFMRNLLRYAEDSTASLWDGVMWTVLLTLSELFRSLLFSLTWAINYRTAIRLRSALLALLYKKILRLNSLGDKSIGEVINLFSNDGQRVFDLVLFGPMVVSGPLTIILGVIYVWWILGPWAVLGFSSFLIFYPIQYGLSRLSGHFRAKALGITDKRLSLVSEILHCIKLIKMYTWEKIFTEKLEDVRKAELSFVRKNAYCVSLTSSLSTTVPFIASIVTFLVHIAAGNVLTPSQGFPLVAFFTTIFRLSILYSQYGISNIIDLIKSCHRFKRILLLSETSVYWSRPLNKTLALSISDGTFERLAFSAHPLPVATLKTSKNLKGSASKKLLNGEAASANQTEYTKILYDINFFAPKGKVIGICGQVGSGKSSLLSAVLGQMVMTKGKICREGRCALVSQQPWLINATLKENILFGEKFNPERYFKCVYSACLNEDIACLPGGDDTEVGERGVNLSGGQKQRVALARALYADRDIYLLDDPLSSVDSHVSTEIFERYILGSLSGKTVLLVTHQMNFLKKCDGIVVMKDGTIVERGSHAELMEADGEYRAMVELWAAPESPTTPLPSPSEEGAEFMDVSLDNQAKSNDDKKLSNGRAGVLVESERQSKGSISLDTMLSYVRASGGPFSAFLLLLIVLLNVGSTAFSYWWLALWLNASNGTASYNSLSNSTSFIDFEENRAFSVFYVVYALSIGAILLSGLVRGYTFALVTLKASRYFHDVLLMRIMKSPLQFFETTPIGRVQNLFSKDIDEIEGRLPSTLESLVQHLWQLIFALLFISLVFPIFIFPMVIIAVVFYVISKIFRVGMREVKRIENTTRGPIFSTVTTTVLGLDTIHAFNKESAFLNQFGSVFNLNTTCLFLVSLGSRWLAIRIDAIAVFVVFVTGCLVVGLHGVVPPALAGLAISYASSLSGMFQYMVRLMCEAEVKLLSVERINLYLSEMKEEGCVPGEDSASRPGSVRSSSPLVSSWPSKGCLSFHNVTLSYRSGLPPALHNVSFKLSPAQKIGVVGRTGSGKSSLVAALLRLSEISGGKIRLDGRDLASVPLEVLRQAITVVPQDPVMLSGTIRYNVDPGGKESDGEVWLALEKCRLKERISSLEHGLETAVGSGADAGLSLGERQLLCLSRALLRKSKVIVLDEATSGLDRETESLLMDAVSSEFADSTVLTIAHRIHTVSNSSDKILVMDHGSVAEFDEPSKLLENPDSAFSKLCAASSTTQH